jgi:hypothetical protein
MLEQLPKNTGLPEIWRELDRIREIQKESLRIQRGSRPNAGQTWGSQPILTVNAKPLLLFFTTDYAQYNQMPTNQAIYVPTWPFRVLVVLNEGNADIMFDVNRKPGDVRLTTVLRAQENVQIPPSGSDIDKFSIFSFQAQAITAGGPNPGLNAQNWNSDQTTAHVRLMAVT